MFFRRNNPQNDSTDQMMESQSGKISFMVKREVKQFLDAGRNHFDNGQFEEAIDQYKMAVEADPSCALCYFNLGYAFQENGDINTAQDFYEKAVELEPTCSLFLEHLARIKFEANDYKEAIRLFQRASMVGTIQPLSLGLWGRALFEQGMYEQSVETFENLLQYEDRPEIQVGARYWLAIGHTKIGRIAAARKVSQKILSYKDVDHKILYDLGENFIESRCLSLAKQVFERLIIEKEELLLARLRLEDIRSLEKKIDDILPNLYDLEEERLLHQIHILREFGNDRVSKALLSFVKLPSAPVRESVVRYQTAYGYNVAQKLLPLLKDEVNYVREAAYDYFDKLDDEKYLDSISAGLDDPLLSIRKKTTKFIGRFGTIELLPKLEMSLEAPKNRECRAEIRQAIASVKRRYQKNMDALYNISIPAELEKENSSSKRGWKIWVILILQFFLLSYFLYVLITRF